MVKGASRRIVEIKGSDGSCFERAIFFVRRDIPKNTPETTLTQEAGRIIDEFCTERSGRPPARAAGKLRKILSIAGAGAAGAGVTLLCRALGLI